MNFTNSRLISASAGSGKTFQIIEEIETAIVTGKARAESIIATTFTQKAALELRDRLDSKLAQSGNEEALELLDLSLIGTIHSICYKLLQEFSFESGLAQEFQILDDRMAELLFTSVLNEVITYKEVKQLTKICRNFSWDLNWQEPISELYTQARSCAMSGERIRECGAESVFTLLSHFPETHINKQEWKSAILKEIRNIIPLLESSEVGKTKDTVHKLRFIKKTLEQGFENWGTFLSLLTLDAEKGLDELLIPLRTMAAHYGEVIEYQQEISQWILLLFDITARVLELYTLRKKQSRFLDYTDLESMTYTLLQKPSIHQQLAHRFDFFVVDEFQDTNPIQVAIFQQLSNLAKETLWVGDQKQSIYAFRGADSALMETLFTHFRKVGAIKVINTSYRSVPELVHATNHLFTDFYQQWEIPAAEICLTPYRKSSPQTGIPLNLVWLTAKKKEDMADALANQVGEIIATNQHKENFSICDIAILFCKNKDVTIMAEKLRERGIESDYIRPGLLKNPEILLVLATYRYLINYTDSLALAELKWLSGGIHNAENWLNEGLEKLNNKEQEDPKTLAFTSLRKNLDLYSMAELLEHAIALADTVRVLLSWNHPRERLHNLNMLRNFLDDYQTLTAFKNQAITARGFIDYLVQLARDKEDNFPLGINPDCVNLSTYHASKGLQWPIVLLGSLNDDPKDYLHGVRLYRPATECSTNFDDLLSQQVLHYWPNLFGNRSKNLPIRDALLDSSLFQQFKTREIREKLNLLYVGFTRAQNQLFLTGQHKVLAKRDAFSIIWLEEQSELLLIPTETGPQEIHIDNIKIPIEVMYQKPGIKNQLTIAETKDVWPTIKEHNFTPFSSFSPTTPGIENWLNPVAGKMVSHQFTDAVRCGLREDAASLGNAIHFMLASFHRPGRTTPNPEWMAEVMADFGDATEIDINSLERNFNQFHTWINTHYQPNNILTEVTMGTTTEGNQLWGIADMLLEKSGKWILVDHKTAIGDLAYCEKKSTEYLVQMEAYRRMIEDSTGQPVSTVCLHYPISGVIVEIEL